MPICHTRTLNEIPLYSGTMTSAMHPKNIVVGRGVSGGIGRDVAGALQPSSYMLMRSLSDKSSSPNQSSFAPDFFLGQKTLMPLVYYEVAT